MVIFVEALQEMTYTKEQTLRERVNEILTEIKMTKAELALQIQCSRPAVSQYLNGKLSPSNEILAEEFSNREIYYSDETR